MIFVTGGTGLVGSHLLFELAKKGERVRALKRAPSDISIVKKVFSYYSSDPETLFSKIEWVDGDITEVNSLMDAMQDADHVYHCAGMVSYDPDDADDILKVNGEGTANIVNVCLEKKIKKLCHVSSVAAFGDLPQHTLIDEHFFWKGCAKYNYYSIGKYNAEREVWRGIEEGLNAVIVNPAVIVGPGNWNMSSCMIFKKSYEGLSIYPQGGAGYIDVRDVVKAMLRLMESGITAERYILSAENISFRDFAFMVHDALGKKRPSMKAGKFLLGLGWRLEKWRAFIMGRAPVLTKVIAKAVHTTTLYSNEKLKKDLHFTFIPVNESVKATAKLFLEDLKK